MCCKVRVGSPEFKSRKVQILTLGKEMLIKKPMRLNENLNRNITTLAPQKLVENLMTVEERKHLYCNAHTYSLMTLFYR